MAASYSCRKMPLHNKWEVYEAALGGASFLLSWYTSMAFAHASKQVVFFWVNANRDMMLERGQSHVTLSASPPLLTLSVGKFDINERTKGMT